jgi:3',5'-cyclic AMP phosphodiesterase CpdA
MLLRARFLRTKFEISHKLAEAAAGWRRSRYLVASGYLSLLEGALLGVALAFGVVAVGVLVQFVINLSGIIWVSALAPGSMGFLILVWAFIGAAVSAALDLVHPLPGTEDNRSLSLIYLFFSILFLLYAWLGVAGMSGVLELAVYLLALVLISLLALRHKVASWALIVPYALFPLAITILLGLYSYSQLIEAVPHGSGAPAPNGRPLFMHLSDTHFVGREEGLTFQGAAWTTQNIEATARLVRRLQPRLLLVSGDVTDTGARREWEQAMNRLLRPATEARSKVILAPGTHDVHPAFGGADDTDSDFFGLSFQFISQIRTVRELAKMESPWTDRLPFFSRWQPTFATAMLPVPSYVRGVLLSRRFLEYQEQLGTGVTAEGTPVSERLQRKVDIAALADIAAGGRENSLSDFAKVRLVLARCSRPPAESSAALQNACDALRETLGSFSALGAGVSCDNLYPLLYRDEQAQASIIVLCDAAVAARGFGSAALGSINKAQLARFRQVLDRLPPESRYAIVMLHHRPIRPRDDRWGLPKTLRASDWSNSPLYHYSFLRGDDVTANELVTTILDHAGKNQHRTYALLYGHAHQKFLGKVYGREGQGQLWISETSALYEEVGARVAYPGPEGKDLVWAWVKP